MKSITKSNISLWLIGCSLSLLAASEAFWLYRTYGEQRRRLAQEVEQVLRSNVLDLQMLVLQRDNPKILDSLIVERMYSDSAQRVLMMNFTFEDKHVKAHINASKQKYFKLLDTLAQLKAWSAKDQSTIDNFIKKNKQGFIERVGSWEAQLAAGKDSFNVLSHILKEYKNAIGQLWWLYELQPPPQYNRPILDSFLNAVKINYTHKNYPVWQSSRVGMKVYTNDSFKLDKKHNPSGKIQVIIGSDKPRIININTNDSLPSFHPSDLFRMARRNVTPEMIKMRLDTTFKNTNLIFKVGKYKQHELISSKKGELVVFLKPIGANQFTRREDDKIGVAIAQYRPYILGKILPEIVFSLLVLGVTAFSFWLIYHNFNQQKRLTDLKNDFISNITHELKTPITTVGVALEALNNFNVLEKPEQAREYLDISKNELNRLSMLVDKVLKMALFAQKEWVIQPVDVDCKTLIEQVISSMKIQFEKYNATVDFTCTGGSFMLKADRTHLTNVVYNLLDNALKYGGEKPKVHISLVENAFDMRIAIQDSGIGIPPQYQSKIFDKFFRVPTGNVHTVKGHGLGLSYVHSVIEKHGGGIQLDSTEGAGSLFTIILPK